MYRMLIADDEALARYALRTLISKNFTNIEVAGEAENGSQAVELNRDLKCDIVVIDIKMPGINGIEASKKILEQYPGTTVLITTAYDNFNYIQQALEIGIKGYLLKPLKKAEVLEKLTKVLQDREDRKSKEDFREQVESKIKAVKPFIEKELISAFISGNTDIDEVKSYINLLQEKLEAGNFMLISFFHGGVGHINDAVRNKIYRNKVYEAVVNYLPTMKKCIFGSNIGNAIVVFFPSDNMDVKGKEIDKALHIGEEIKKRIKVVTGIDVAIGIGNTYHGIQNLKNSFSEANSALRKGLQKGEVIHFSLVADNTISAYPEYPYKVESELLESIRVGNMEKARETGIQVIVQIFHNNYNIACIKEYASQLITIFKRTVVQIGVHAELIQDTGILLELNMLDDAEEIRIWCLNSINSILDVIDIHKHSKDGGAIIKKVQAYLNKHIYREIMLEMVAKEVNLTPQYLSKIFKEEYGKNFIDYITEKRIEMAKDLLRTENKSIKEISTAVGYIDSNYFCRIFKKVVGLTPKEYRDNH